MLPTDIFEIRKRLLKISVAKPKYNVELIFETSWNVDFGDAHYITYLSFKNTVEIATPQPVLRIAFL
jgi:hypothetical protein